MRAAWPLLAVLLAGCAGDAPAVLEPGDATFSDAPARASRPFATLTWVVVATGEVTLATARDAALPVDVPPGALSVSVNATLRSGAAYGLGIELGECRWHRETPFVAGQVFAVDCGGVGVGGQTLALRTTAGALVGGIAVVALVCRAGTGTMPCPAPFPPTTS